MKTILDVAVSVLTLLGLAWGLYYGVRSFGLKRERFTFLGVAVEATTFWADDTIALVSITVTLTNKGDSRISGRRNTDAQGYVYDTPPDTCRYAGTLKIRSVPSSQAPLLFDWYSLPVVRTATRLVPATQLVESETELEQINYLDEYMDPDESFQKVDFWLEPKEAYAQSVFIWLRPGLYAAKAFFFGVVTTPGEEEYWSNQVLLKVAPPSSH